MLVARLVVRPLDSAESALQGRSPTALTLVSSIETVEAKKDRTLAEVSTEATPERVPLAGLVISARDLKEPVPDCNHNAPAVDSP